MELVLQVISQVLISSLLISLLLTLNSQLLLLQIFFYKIEKKNKYSKWVLYCRIYELIFPFLKQFGRTVWALGYIYVTERFPSVVRSLALCLISAGGSFGSIAQAFLSNLCSSLNVHSMVAFGIISVLCALLLFPLRETLHQPLREKIEEDQTRIRSSMLHIYDQEQISSPLHDT
ncbi:unnamed protein product [Paramecium pentaurelia]|uniref:Uncharacterized protein n=1 Tax=Paramecium pentaurelia TaxID=43138 RepID=A0A8S1YGW9_9CILI|nr:unnamed protein product [Paramecium pentaurelia]